jgi:hypothetical protein
MPEETRLIKHNKNLCLKWFEEVSPMLTLKVTLKIVIDEIYSSHVGTSEFSVLISNIKSLLILYILISRWSLLNYKRILLLIWFSLVATFLSWFFFILRNFWLMKWFEFDFVKNKNLILPLIIFEWFLFIQFCAIKLNFKVSPNMFQLSNNSTITKRLSFLK